MGCNKFNIGSGLWAAGHRPTTKNIAYAEHFEGILEESTDYV